ncbi:MAG: hypothetical protein RL404_718 [Pseudomonadota bacterium]|jgi:uncharacterized membrane protein YqjE
MEENTPATPGLIAHARTLLTGMAGLARTRTSLAMLELADARDALLQVMFMGATALLLAGFALACLSALVVALCWDALGWGILLLLFLIYAGLSVLLLQRARAIVASGRIGLPATMEELRKDREALVQGDAE